LPAGLNIAGITGPNLMIVPKSAGAGQKTVAGARTRCAAIANRVNVLVMNKNMLTGPP